LFCFVFYHRCIRAFYYKSTDAYFHRYIYKFKKFIYIPISEEVQRKFHHTRDIHDYVARLGLADSPLDEIPLVSTSTLFKTHISDTQETVRGGSAATTETPYTPPLPPMIAIYTDGSKLENSSTPEWGTGAGFAIFEGLEDLPIQDKPPVAQGRVNLCHSFTVFMAEITAISLAIREYHRLRRTDTIAFPPGIVIFSDSQAAIRALAATTIHSRTVLECKHLLNATALFTTVTLRWVKAHAASCRNNWVDGLAKEGARNHVSHGPFPKDLIPMAFLKQALRMYSRETWQDQWHSHPTCRQTKLWFPGPNPGVSRKILSLDRVEIGLIIRWLTGHNFLRRHSKIVDPHRFAVDTCRLCGLEPESAAHIISECMALDFNRLATLRATHLPLPYSWDLFRLLRFLGPIAEKLEDVDAPPTQMTLLTSMGTRVMTLDRTESTTDQSQSTSGEE